MTFVADKQNPCLSVCRWDDLDCDPVTWHITDWKGDRHLNGADVTDKIFTTEPWQLAVNGIY